MQSQSLVELAEHHLDRARQSRNGRSAVTVYGGHQHRLRQTLIALASGHTLGDHEAPGEATLRVLHGDVRMTAGSESWEGKAGAHLAIPPRRHDLYAVTDSVVLLSVAVG